MKTSKVVLILIALMFVCLTGFADDRYQFLSEGVYIDTQTAKHSPKETQDYLKHPELLYQDDGYVDVWIKFIYTSEEVKDLIKSRKEYGLSTEDFEKASYRLAHYQIKTNQKEIRSIQFIAYDSNGKVLVSTPPDNNSTWKGVIPDSVGEMLQREVVHYMKNYYITQELKQRDNQSLSFLRQKDNLENQWYWILSNDKQINSFDIYSVKMLDENIAIVRTKSTFNQAGVADVISYWKRQDELLGGLKLFNTEGWGNLNCQYSMYILNLKDKQYINYAWVYVDKYGTNLQTVTVPEMFEKKWHSVSNGLFEEKLIDTLSNWTNANYEFVHRKK